jgi:hypothetical protein
MKMSGKLYHILSIMFVILLFLPIGCSELEEIYDPVNTEEPVQTGDPGAGNLAGMVLGTLSEQPLAGITVSARGKTTTTNSDGTFSLSGVGTGTFAVLLTSSVTYTRTAAVNTGTNSGRWVELDVFETSNFDLRFYRELVRGNHPAEDDLFPIRRWTTQPTVYIDSNSSSVRDGVIDQTRINTARSVLSTVIPIFTGGSLSVNQIQIQEFPDNLCLPSIGYCSFGNIPDNSIVVSFDDSIMDVYPTGVGVTITTPDFTQYYTRSINKAVVLVVDYATAYSWISFEETLAHEVGHALGFRHVTDYRVESVMYKNAILGRIYSSADRQYMPIMYNRPTGNSDIDNDAVSGTKIVGSPPEVEVHVDQRGNYVLSPEVIDELQALPGRIPYDRLQSHIAD